MVQDSIAGIDQNENGWIALMFSAINGHEAIVIDLLEYPVNVNAKKTDGRTPLIDSSKKGNVSIVHIILGKGSEVHA